MLDPDWQISVEGDTMSQIPVEAVAETGMWHRITRDWDLSVCIQHWDLIIFLVPRWDMHFKKKHANNVLFNVTETLWRRGKRCALRCDVIVTDVMNKRSAGQPVPDSHARYQTEKVGTPLPVEFSCLRYENSKSLLQHVLSHITRWNQFHKTEFHEASFNVCQGLNGSIYRVAGWSQSHVPFINAWCTLSLGYFFTEQISRHMCKYMYRIRYTDYRCI